MKIIKKDMSELDGSHTPVLDYCRQLISEGEDPSTSLEVYRGNVLSMRVNVGNGASLTVSTNKQGTPVFRRVEGSTEVAD